MRIAYILPGSGDTFYCQNCVRDITLVKALRKRGHDVVIVPLYLPPFADGQEEVDDAPVFFGGLSTYLQQKYVLFRKTPRWIDRILDARPILKRLAKHSGSTKAAELGRMTVSMLMGEHGNQRKEVVRLVDWLENTIQPDLVHFSTALLLGMLPSLKERLDVKIVCSLQDEDLWIDAMHKQDAEEVWQLIGRHAEETDRFVAVSNYYAHVMSGKMGIPAEKIDVVYPGIPLEEYAAAASAPANPTIGYLSKMTDSLGIGLLVDAFVSMKKDPRWNSLNLKITGGRTSDDRAEAELLMRKLEAEGCAADVEFVWDFDRASRIKFLQTLSVLSVPSEQGEAFGLHIAEALACGVPVVQPRSGAYPELVEKTGGGLLCDPGSSVSLAEALADLLADSNAARAMGREGCEAAQRMFSTDSVVEGMLQVYNWVY